MESGKKLRDELKARGEESLKTRGNETAQDQHRTSRLLAERGGDFGSGFLSGLS